MAEGSPHLTQADRHELLAQLMIAAGHLTALEGCLTQDASLTREGAERMLSAAVISLRRARRYLAPQDEWAGGNGRG